MADAPTEADFRKAGMSANAVNFPLSPEAFVEKCAFNGTTTEAAPMTMRYAANEICRQDWQKRAERNKQTDKEAKT